MPPPLPPLTLPLEKNWANKTKIVSKLPESLIYCVQKLLLTQFVNCNAPRVFIRSNVVYGVISYNPDDEILACFCLKNMWKKQKNRSFTPQNFGLSRAYGIHFNISFGTHDPILF